jgi:hypothetical protein
MCANYTPTRLERLAAQAGVPNFEPYDFKPESYPGYLAPSDEPTVHALKVRRKRVNTNAVTCQESLQYYNGESDMSPASLVT